MIDSTPILGGYCGAAEHHPLHGAYHDEEYGFPTDADRARLMAERLFKKALRFTGGENTREFLMSIGYLPGSHDPACPVFDRILRLTPPWKQTTSGGS